MISWSGKTPTAIYWLGKAITSIYWGTREVWVLFLSCFGRGYWMNELPWNNTDAWKNEP